MCEANESCPYTSAERREMLRHYRASHQRYAEQIGIPLDPFVCVECEKEFSRNDNRLKHWKKYHEEELGPMPEDDE